MGRDRLGCFNVRGVLAAAEPGAAPDRGRIAISRDNKLLQRPRQVSFGVRPMILRELIPLASATAVLCMAIGCEPVADPEAGQLRREVAELKQKVTTQASDIGWLKLQMEWLQN